MTISSLSKTLIVHKAKTTKTLMWFHENVSENMTAPMGKKTNKLPASVFSCWLDAKEP
jgi:hypothetical protein